MAMQAAFQVLDTRGKLLCLRQIQSPLDCHRSKLRVDCASERTLGSHLIHRFVQNKLLMRDLLFHPVQALSRQTDVR